MEAIRIVEAGDLKKDRGGFRPGEEGPGVSGWTAFVLTQVDEVGTLRPCAWGVPGLRCVPTSAARASGPATAICASPAFGWESAVFDTPDRVGRRRVPG